MSNYDDGKPKVGSTWKNVAVLVLIVLGMRMSVGWLNKKANLKNDNLAEQTVEMIIKETLGIDVDLTPDSPE